MTEKCNRQIGNITENNLTLWNKVTVKHEISLCSECLLGIPRYNMKGSIEQYGKNSLVCEVWILRLNNAIKEAKVRFLEDKDYINELDDIEFIIDYELV